MALTRRRGKGKGRKGKKAGTRSRRNARVHTLQRIKKFMGGKKTRNH
jgi:hypothetical protein